MTSNHLFQEHERFNRLLGITIIIIMTLHLLFSSIQPEQREIECAAEHPAEAAPGPAPEGLLKVRNPPVLLGTRTQHMNGDGSRPRDHFCDHAGLQRSLLKEAEQLSSPGPRVATRRRSLWLIDRIERVQDV